MAGDHGMASLPTLSLAGGQLSPGMKEAILDLLKYCNKDVHTLEMPTAKLRSRWPESS